MKSSHFRALLVTLAVGFSAGPSAANVFGDSPQTVIDRSRWPVFQAIGVAYRERDISNYAAMIASGTAPSSAVGYGTAFNVGPCTVLSNRHVPYAGEPYPDSESNYRMVYSVGYADASPFTIVAELNPIVYGDLLKSDFSLSIDSKCSGKTVGWYKTSDISTDELVRTQAKVLVVSFPSNKPGQMVASFGKVTGVDPDSGNVLYSASTAPGSSGGVVFVVLSTGEILAQGIHVGGRKKGSDDFTYPNYTQEHANEFINLSEIMYRHDIQIILRADFSVHGTRNPLENYLHVVK
jgi:V8-like Glu-specific endopeptidase